VTLQRLRRSGNKFPVIGKLAKKSACQKFNVLKHAFPMRLRFPIFFILLSTNSHRSGGDDRGRARGSDSCTSRRRRQQHKQRIIAEVDGRRRQQ